MRRFLFCDIDYTVVHFSHKKALLNMGEFLNRCFGRQKSEKLTGFIDKCFQNLFAKGRGDDYDKKIEQLIIDASRGIPNPEAGSILWSRELWLCIAQAVTDIGVSIPSAIAAAASASYWNGIAKHSHLYEDAERFFAKIKDNDILEIVFVTTTDARLCLKNGQLAYDAKYSDQRKRERIPRRLLEISKNNIFSGDPVGKPHPEFWKKVFGGLGCELEENTVEPNGYRALMVGDSASSDLQGASRFGFATILIDRTGDTKPENAPDAKYIIQSFDELSKILSII